MFRNYTYNSYYDCSNYENTSSSNDESNDARIDNVKTFQPKIFVSPLDPTTKIHVDFVRIKSSAFSYFWEHTRQNLDEFVPTHRKPGVYGAFTQYFEIEDLSDKDTEKNPKTESDNDQEPDDFWGRLKQELEEEYKDGSDLSNHMENYKTDVENSDVCFPCSI